MGIIIGYYVFSTKNTLKRAREFLHARSQKTSPVTSLRVKNMIQCITEIGLRCLHMKQTSIIYTGLLSVPPPEADLG